MSYFLTISLSAGSASEKPLIKTYLAKEQILEPSEGLIVVAVSEVLRRSKYFTTQMVA